MIKGYAILFMLLLHLTDSPQMVNYDVPSWCGTPICKSFQICVPLFLFMSGFGLYKVLTIKKGFKYTDSFKRILKLYKIYWKVFIIFVPIGFIFFDWKIDLKELIFNFTALTCTYNGIWWFLSLYFELMLIFPLLTLIKCNLWKNILLILIALIATRLLIQLPIIKEPTNILYQHLKMVLINLPIFMTGMLFSRFNLFDKLAQIFKKSHLFNYGIGILLICIPLLGRTLPMIGVTEIILVPMQIMGIIMIYEKTKNSIYSKTILFSGKHSTNMWLIHGFFCYYYFSAVVYSMHNIFLSYILLVIISLCCSIALEKLNIHSIISKS